MKKKIMLIPPAALPIPAVKGGAIETLITNLIEVNEKEQKCELVIISKDDVDAKKFKYQFTKIYYFDEKSHSSKEMIIVNFIYFAQKVLRKILQNHITVKLYGTRTILYPKRYIYARLLAKKHKIDIIINEGNWDESYWTILRKVVGSNNIYDHIHCHRPEDYKARTVIPNSICISEFVKDEWVQSQNIVGKNWVLYNGIDLNLFSNNTYGKERIQIRKSFGVEDDTILVLFCGRLIKEKGISELLKAFDLMKECSIKLLLVGSVGFSANTTTDYSRMISETAARMKNVISCGYIPNEKMPMVYAAADIMVIPSVWQEGAGLVAIEGMAAGLPLITTMSGGMTEYVNDDVAIQIPIDEMLIENLKNNIIMLAKDENKRMKMGRAGKKRAQLYSKERFYSDFIRIMSEPK